MRLFARLGFEFIASQSFAKNFGLYNERVGTLNVVCDSPEQADAVLSQIKRIIRPMYSVRPSQSPSVSS